MNNRRDFLQNVGLGFIGLLGAGLVDKLDAEETEETEETKDKPFDVFDLYKDGNESGCCCDIKPVDIEVEFQNLHMGVWENRCEGCTEGTYNFNPSYDIYFSAETLEDIEAWSCNEVYADKIRKQLRENIESKILQHYNIPDIMKTSAI